MYLSLVCTDCWSVTYMLISEHFKKWHKNQNTFQNPHIFQLFLPKRDRLYTKTLLHSYITSSRSEMSEQLRAESFVSRNLLWPYMSQITRLWFGQMYLSMIEYPKHDCQFSTQHLAKTGWPCYGRHFHLEPTTLYCHQQPLKSIKEVSWLNFPKKSSLFYYLWMVVGT